MEVFPRQGSSMYRVPMYWSRGKCRTLVVAEPVADADRPVAGSPPIRPQAVTIAATTIRAFVLASISIYLRLFILVRIGLCGFGEGLAAGWSICGRGIRWMYSMAGRVRLR